MATYRPDVTRISRYDLDISELPAETANSKVQKHGRTRVNTLPRQGKW